MRKGILLLIFCGSLFMAKSQSVVISQIYGGGGNSGATYTNDFVELFNATGSPVNITGWTIQYQTQGASTWTKTSDLTGTIAAGGYYLISLASGASGIALPTPDFTNTGINLNASQGKVALCNNNTLLTTCASASIVDKVGYGTTSVVCNETANASSPGNNTTSMLRGNNGCTDNNNNSTDFSVGTVNPRNSASPVNICSSTTITVTTLSVITFNIDCSTTGTANLDFTSTGTFNSGNVYTAQLSDASGSFTSPTAIGTLSSTGNSGTIPITIPAGTPSGIGYLIRIVASNPTTTSTNTSVAVTVNLTGTCTTSADFFRSKSSGDWNVASTWESSPTGTAGTWIGATLTPTSAANTIQIRNGHVVKVVAAVTVDQVEIENGGTLDNNLSSGALTIADGTGNDIEVRSGGIYLTTSSQSYVAQISINTGATVHIENLGTIQIGTGGAVGSGNSAYASTASSYIWDDGSIFNWNSTTTPTIQTTFFPGVATNVIPIFRITAIPSFSLGGGTATVINGRLESTVNISFNGNSTKTFRNGILNTGVIDGSAGTSQKFIINGATAIIGGSSDILLPLSSPGLEIGSATGTVATVTSNKTITGDINLISTSTRVDLGNNTLTVNGSITNGGQDAFVRTNGTGALTFPTVATSKEFPIGNTRYSPLRINSGAGGKDFTARVEEGINNPSGAVPTEAVNKTWYLNTTSVAATNVIVEFQYAAADCNPAVLSASTVELLQSDNTTWSLVLPAPPNNVITPAGADPAITATALAGMAIPTNPTPYTVGVTNTIILPIDCIVSCQSRKVNNNGLISWEASSCAQVASFEIQRSTNNGAYVTIGRVTPVTNQLSYQFTDAQLAGGTNLYRIKINGTNGAFKYSNIVAILNSIRGILFTAITPNPVNDKGTLVINAARAGAVNFVLYDLSGKPVRRFTRSIVEGSNTITIEAGDLPAGLYHLAATSGDDRTVLKFIKQ